MADAKQFQVAGTSYDIKDAVARGRVGDVEALIPAEATAQNKLADKEYVNSGIATATATYRGGYNLVSDLQLTTAATESQVTTALVAKMTDLSITPDNNDYCFVQIPTDDNKPTEIARVDRYKFNGTVWGFEFSVNNSGFTAAQWAALNSGITSGLVAKLGLLPTNTELTEALGGKVDKVSGKGLSTNDYTTEEKTKLGALPTNADLTTALSGKQDTINDLSTIRSGATAGATAYQKPQTGIPSTDMSAAVQTSLGKADSALQSHQDISGKADKDSDAVEGNIAVFDENGNPVDGGVALEDLAEASEVAGCVEELSSALYEEMGKDPDMKYGQPRILWGNGTPAEGTVPDNWKQLADGGYNWIGKPAFVGQLYVNTAVTSGGLYMGYKTSESLLEWRTIVA